METIRDWCISHLQEILPGDEVARAPATLNVYAKDPLRAAEIISLGHACQVPTLLPLAYYSLTTSPAGDAESKWSELPQDCDTLIRLSIGKDRLRWLWREYVRSSKDLYTPPDAQMLCDNLTSHNTKCEVGRRTKANARQDAVMMGGADPLRYLFRATNGVTTMCSGCHKEHMEGLRLHLTKIFEALPSVFGLYVPFRVSLSKVFTIPDMIFSPIQERMLKRRNH